MAIRQETCLSWHIQLRSKNQIILLKQSFKTPCTKGRKHENRKRKDLHGDAEQGGRHVREDRAVSELPPHEFCQTCQRHSPNRTTQHHTPSMLTHIYVTMLLSLSSQVDIGQTTQPQVLARHPCPAPTPTVHPCHVLSACKCSGCSRSRVLPCSGW